MRSSGWGSGGSEGYTVLWGTTALAAASPQGSWVKAAEQWVTEQGWPAGGREHPEAQAL